MSRRHAALSIAFTLVLTGPALAQGANPDATAVKPGAYMIEPSHTRVMFSVSHMGFTTWYGEFPGASGQLTLDPPRRRQPTGRDRATPTPAQPTGRDRADRAGLHHQRQAGRRAA